MKVVIAEKLSPSAAAVFAGAAGWNVVTHDAIRNGLAAELADADALIVRSGVRVDLKLLESAPRLRAIGRAGIGVDNIDTDAATRRGIVVMNTPGANAVAVAELAIALMIDLARMVPKANAALHAGRWEKKSLEGTELRGKTLGIIGMGRVGLEVARRARSFGMELVGHDPFVSAKPKERAATAHEYGIRLRSLDEALRGADYVTLHLGLTEETDGMLNAGMLVSMKKGVRIINCARGELIDDEALAAALKSGQVAGAALDVFRKEPLTDSPFFGMENVILTPHIAGSTREAQEAVGIQIAHEIRDYLATGVAQNAVNFPSLSHEEYREISPYLELGERLGKLLAATFAARIESIHLSYAGAMRDLNTGMIRNAALCGLLGSSGHANRVDGSALAAGQGIQVHEETSESAPGGSPSLLKLTVYSGQHTDQLTATMSGTVLHGRAPRLLASDGIDIEAPLDGTLLYIRNRDVPGAIGHIGAVLGEHGINIANFALGRAGKHNREGAGEAVAVVHVDADTPQPQLRQALAALVSLEQVASATLVKLS